MDKSIKITEQATTSMGKYTAEGKPVKIKKKSNLGKWSNFESMASESKRNQEILRRVLKS